MRNFKSRVFLMAFLSVALLYFGSVSRVNATPVLMIDGVVVAATGLTTGNVQYSGTAGLYNVSVAGATKDYLGSASAPHMTLDATVTQPFTFPGVGGSIEIAFTDTDFSATSILGFVNSMTGNITTFGGGSTIEYKYFISTDNLPGWNDGVNDVEMLPSAVGGYSFIAGVHNKTEFFDFSLNSLSLTDKYALTIVATITHDASAGMFNTTTFFAETAAVPEPTTAVPEPTTVALLGIGLAGLFGGYLVRRKTRRGNGESNSNH